MMRGNKPKRNQVKRQQPKKDSSAKRVNYDNERESKFDKDMDGVKDPKIMNRSRGCNDVSWYANGPELLRAAASVPFVDVTGQPLPDGTSSVPGVMSLTWMPFVGGGDNAINQAANQIYSNTVHANSRNQSYDAPDEMLLILAGAQVFSFLALGMRAYGIMRRYSQQDRYTPDALLAASLFDAGDLRNNYSNMWFDLNQLIAKSRQIWIPNVMPLIQRWFWLNSNIYRDGSSVKAQYYMFAPSVIYMYSETSSSSGGQLLPTKWDAALHSWSQYVTQANSMINALINSQDRGIIFGDILKAYGSDNLYAISDLPVDYAVEPVYDREVLSQIENATTFPITTPGPISQYTGGSGLYQLATITNVKYDGTSKTFPAASQLGAGDQLLINFHQLETPTPEQIMVATRLQSAGMSFAGHMPNESNIQQWAVNPAYAGSEFITAIRMYVYGWSGGTPSLLSRALNTNQASFATSDELMRYMSFDWAPMLYNITRTDFNMPANYSGGDNVLGKTNYAIADYDNYTYISAEVVNKMHTTAVYSEFGVPFHF